MFTRRDLLYALGCGAAWALDVSSHSRLSSFASAQGAIEFELPRSACDCHVHIFDPKFPYASKRVYTPPAARVEDLIGFHAALHFERVVIVQPSVYAADNSCTLDAVRRLGRRARAVTVIDQHTSQGELEEMTAAGVRGIRLNLHTTPRGEINADGAKRSLNMAAKKIGSLGWHVQFYAAAQIIGALKETIEQLPLTVVFDHFGGAQAAAGPSQPGFDAVLDLVHSGRAYVKVSAPYRISNKSPDFSDVSALAQALIAANAERVLWGSDWPHPDSSYGRGASQIAPPLPVDSALLLNQLPRWTADPAIRAKILVSNPARLYGFEAA